MANRHTLAVSKLEDFKQWLIDNDWKIEQTKGKYEVLRARKETEKLPLIVYKKDKEGLVHLSVSDWNLKYVEQFINSKNQKVETAWVIQRDDGKFYTECSVKDVNYSKNIWFAFKCSTKEEVEWCIKGIKELENCKPVKVEIRVVEE